MSAKREVIAELYRQLGAPDWASPNLDGLTDVLRDLSWLPEKPVVLTLPDLSGLSGPEREMLLHVLARAATESIGSPRPVRVRSGDA